MIAMLKVTLTVNTPFDTFQYEFETSNPNEEIAKAWDMHPDATSLLMTIVLPSRSAPQHADAFTRS